MKELEPKFKAFNPAFVEEVKIRIRCMLNIHIQYLPIFNWELGLAY